MSTKIIALAENSWDGPWMNRQQILSRLGKSADVLYSNGPYFSWSRSKETFKKSSFFGGFSDKDNVLVDSSPKYLLKYQGVRTAEMVVDYLCVSRWRRTLEIKKTDELIAYIFSPTFYNFVNIIKPDKVVYHIYDVFSSSPGWNASLQESHEALIRDADIVFASSDEIKKSVLKYRPNLDVIVVENGVDYKSFSNINSYKELADLKNIPHPRIGYTGNINMKVDMELIVSLAIKQPDWNFIFVGRVGDLGSQALFYDQAKNQGNVYFLGQKTVQDLPSYMDSMDVNIMNYSTSKGLWSFSGYPLKMHEYLAVGKPVVSSRLPSIESFGDVILICDNAEEWETGIAACLNEDDFTFVEKRRNVAKRYDWDALVLKIADVIGVTRM
ncbi:MAG: glycosyltransferase [Pseudomonadales bacterium]|nr:glycosyltransferase [Pseudomonadales bacterium]